MKALETGRVLMKSLFGQVPAITPEELRRFLDQHPPDSYTLLDVRQPGEYEKEHLPGARLIPLPQLSQRLEEVDRERPVQVYCAIGGRSRAAAEMLLGRGFKDVRSLKGGIRAWQGHTAAGPLQSPAPLFQGEQSLAAFLLAAHGMELELARFYEDLAQAMAGEQEAASLLRRLAGIEERHRQKVRQLFLEADPSPQQRQSLDEEWGPGLLEGGWSPDEMRDSALAAGLDRERVLSLAMMIEAQALDLYLRLAQSLEDKPGARVLEEIAKEEQAHLISLGQLMDKEA